MRKLIFWCIGLSLLWVIAGCAGSSSGGLSSTSFRSDLGLTTGLVLSEQAERILIGKHQYQIQIFDQSSDRSYFETAWKDRLLFDDEREAGVKQAKSRIILEGRARLRASVGSTLRVKFKGENQLLYQKTGNGETGSEITPLCKEYFKEIANDLKTEFSTRIREF